MVPILTHINTETNIAVSGVGTYFMTLFQLIAGGCFSCVYEEVSKL